MYWDNENCSLTLVPTGSISDQVFEFLKKLILNGEIKPGERLMQKQVAETLNTSRTPVREAFRKLEQDGLVERVPQGGVRATLVSDETIDEVFGVRSALEAYAIELACDYITIEDIALLRDLRNQAQEVLNSSRLDSMAKRKQLINLNSHFHETIYQATRNRYLIRLINDLRSIVLRLRALGLRAEGTWHQAWLEHDRLIDLLEKRDKEAASQLMKQHIKNAASNVTIGVMQVASQKTE